MSVGERLAERLSLTHKTDTNLINETKGNHSYWLNTYFLQQRSVNQYFMLTIYQIATCKAKRDC